MSSPQSLAMRQITRRYGPNALATEWTLAAFEQMSPAQRRKLAAAVTAQPPACGAGLEAALDAALAAADLTEMRRNVRRGAERALDWNDRLVRGARKIGERAALLSTIERIAAAVMAGAQLDSALRDDLTEPFAAAFGRRP